jgi:hypothetical protein
MLIARRPKGTTLPKGLRLARSRDLVSILIVRAISFVGAGRDASEVRQSMLSVIDGIRDSIREQQVIVNRSGTAYIRWHVEPGRGWKLDEVAAFSRGRGHGTLLLRTFLSLADAGHMPVTLACPKGRIDWYRRHGFRLQAPGVDPVAKAYLAAGLILMRRPANAGLGNRRRASARARSGYDTLPQHQIAPLRSDRVKSLVTVTKSKITAATMITTALLVGTAGCSPDAMSPVYAAYTAGSDLQR